MDDSPKSNLPVVSRMLKSSSVQGAEAHDPPVTCSVTPVPFRL